MAVVVTNQVVDVMDSADNVRIGNLSILHSSGRKVCPALGLSWANCVNTRLFLWREYERVGEEGGSFDDTKTRRFAAVVFAPHLPYSSSEFVIRREGVWGVDK